MIFMKKEDFHNDQKQHYKMITDSRDQSADHIHIQEKKIISNIPNPPSSSSSSSTTSTTTTTSRSSVPWSSRSKDPRIVRVSRAFGGKDRHSKVCTVRGLRDRRVRLSVPTAIQLYDLQERLGLNQPSKVVDWLLNAAKDEIDELPPLQIPQALMPNYSNLRGKSKGEEEEEEEDKQYVSSNNNINSSSSSSSLQGLVSNNFMPYNSFYRVDPWNYSLISQLGGGHGLAQNCSSSVGGTTTTTQTYFPNSTSMEFDDDHPKQVINNHLQMFNTQTVLPPLLYSIGQSFTPFHLRPFPCQNNNDVGNHPNKDELFPSK